MSSGFHHAWRSEIRNALRETMPHVVYAHHTVPWISHILLHAAKELNIPAVMMYHSDVTGPEWTKRILGFFYYHFFARRSFNLCDAFLVPSKTFAACSPYLGTVKQKFISAPPGVDPVMAEGRRALGQPYLLFVGKPHLKSKGFDLLVQAFPRLHAQWPGLELVVVGRTAPRYRKLEEKGIRYVGYVAARKALADWYASALVTVLPSTIPGESFGMVMAEALMAGCPVVGPHMGGITELVEDGQNGYLFSPGDVADLVNAIDRAMKNQKALRSHIRRNRKLYQERFDWDRTAEIVANTLRSAARCDS
jgi:glycosyltransferase involved in cell wall biosynthesis